MIEGDLSPGDRPDMLLTRLDLPLSENCFSNGIPHASFGPTTPKEMSMLELQHVSHVYPNGTRALNDVTLSIPRGMYGLLGPNGAGKSTLMRAIATLQSPTEGSIRFGDIDVIAQPEQLRRTLGYLPQDFGVYPRISAYDMLDHLAVLKGIASRADRKQTVETLLHQVNLWNVRKKTLSGFSGGMRQRFGIAQALIGNPELIIVDEPTAGLDPEERNRFLNLLAEIGENVVVILSTHIVADVADLCPRMAVLADGRVQREGAPRELIDATRGRIWMKVIERSDMQRYREQYELLSTRLFSGKTIIHVLSERDPGDGFTAIEAGLEDVYFSTLAESRRAA
jgi:ABC-2 type transport system ATP-binding protein